MRCNLWLPLLWLVASPLTAADPDGAHAIAGVWEAKNKKDTVHIEIQSTGDGFSGSIVWIKEKLFPLDDPRGMGGKPKVDRNNPDPALRSRPIVGLRMLGNMQFAGNGEWKGGWIYAPDDGRKARCKVKLTPNGTLRVRGFIGTPLFGRTVVWSRVGNTP